MYNFLVGKMALSSIHLTLMLSRRTWTARVEVLEKKLFKRHLEKNEEKENRNGPSFKINNFKLWLFLRMFLKFDVVMIFSAIQGMLRLKYLWKFPGITLNQPIKVTLRMYL